MLFSSLLHRQGKGITPPFSKNLSGLPAAEDPEQFLPSKLFSAVSNASNLITRTRDL